jgi:hypothetical protein
MALHSSLLSSHVLQRLAGAAKVSIGSPSPVKTLNLQMCLAAATEAVKYSLLVTLCLCHIFNYHIQQETSLKQRILEMKLRQPATVTSCTSLHTLFARPCASINRRRVLGQPGGHKGVGSNWSCSVSTLLHLHELKSAHACACKADFSLMLAISITSIAFMDMVEKIHAACFTTEKPRYTATSDKRRTKIKL